MNTTLDILENVNLSDEEMDELFSQMEHFVPPTDMVERVMNAVSQLPLPQVFSYNENDLDELAMAI